MDCRCCLYHVRQYSLSAKERGELERWLRAPRTEQLCLPGESGPLSGGR